MSSSSSSSGASKKKQQDEQNLKILRELASLLPNKQCFDCHQRGPTYVNMTIGSFVCTSCSGLLRGLNPPHRVKSISMAIFTSDEIELLKSRGNEYCRRVWVGRYDRGGRSPLEDGASKDETQMKDYLVLKYEKKRWYVSPSEAFANSPPPVQQIPSSSQNNNATSTTTTAASTGGVSQMSAPRSHSSSVVTAPPSIQNHPPQSRPSPQQHPPQPNNNHDLFLKNPVSPPAPTHPSSSSADILFDPFGSSAGFGSSVSSPSGSLQHHQSPPIASSNGVFQNLQPSGGGMIDGASVPKSATVPSGFLVPSATNQQLQPISTQQQMQQQQQQGQGQPKQPILGAGDKWAALAELDDLFRSTSPVDANLGADRRQTAPTSTGPASVYPPSSATSNSNFYQTRPPAPTSANPAVNPFATNSPAAAGQYFGGVNQSSTAGFGYFPTTGAVNATAQQMQGYRPSPPQQYHQPPMNPFAGPMANPRPTTGATSWNPFL